MQSLQLTSNPELAEIREDWLQAAKLLSQPQNGMRPDARPGRVGSHGCDSRPRLPSGGPEGSFQHARTPAPGPTESAWHREEGALFCVRAGACESAHHLSKLADMFVPSLSS